MPSIPVITVVSSGVSFDGQGIFGSQTKVTGPYPRPRVQRETIPGVSGFRVYRLAGSSTVTWEIRGRLSSGSRLSLETAILRTQQRYCNGRLFTFRSKSGMIFRNCLLNDYRPEGPPMYVQGGVTQNIAAVVEWTTPENF